MNILLGLTGSIAVIKAHELCLLLNKLGCVRVVYTKNVTKFININDISDVVDKIYSDKQEWNMWKKRGDKVLHIEIQKWADILIIAPLTANTLSKISNGICDNLLTSIIVAWDFQKPFIIAPAMNKFMWKNPIIIKNLEKIKLLKIKIISPIIKRLACGDISIGAMAEVESISGIISNI